MEEWGRLTKEGNFVFTQAWTLLKSKGLDKRRGTREKTNWLDVIYTTVFH
jgi:hypothetical protein